MVIATMYALSPSFDHISQLSDEEAPDMASYAIRHGSPRLLADLVGRFDLEHQKPAMLASALLEGKPSCTYVLLESGCEDRAKELALETLNTAVKQKYDPLVYNAGHAMAAAMVLDHGMKSNLPVANETLAAIKKFITNDPHLTADRDAIWYESEDNRADPKTSFFTRPAVAAFGRMVGFGAFVESKASQDHVKRDYPLYTAIASRMDDFWFTMQPMDAPGLDRILARGKSGPAVAAPAS